MKDYILEASNRYQVSPVLIAGIIHTESKGNTAAMRYEPQFFNRYIKTTPYNKLLGHKPTQCSQTTEKHLRSCSLGVMQIMGETAREHEFSSEWLTDLILYPRDNIMLGTKILYKFLSVSDFDVDKTLLRWNGGGNKDYPALVTVAMTSGDYQAYLV